MKDHFDFVKTTVAGGFFVFLPVVILTLLLQQIWILLDGVVTPLANIFPVEYVGGVEIAFLITVAVILFLCFLGGLALRTNLGTRINDWLDRAILDRIPGYSLIKNLTSRFSDKEPRTAVLARIHGAGAWAIGFVIEELETGEVVVFVPLAPTPTAGTLYVLAPEDLRILEATMGATLNCVMQWGIGAREVIRPRAESGA